MTVHEGSALPPGELIAPAVGTDKDQPNFHNNYQDIEAFLAAGGRRGLQYIQWIGQGEGQKASQIGEGEGKRIAAIGNAERRSCN